MTIPELIERVLTAIRDQFYTTERGEVRGREYMRDHRALTQAVARWGYECDRRGWDMQPHEVVAAMLKLLGTIKAPDHQYLPTYLESCIDRHLRQRAEEYAAKAKSIDHNTGQVIAKVGQAVTGTAVRELTTVEVLAEVYKGMTAIARRKKALAKESRQERVITAPKPKQASLF